MKTSRKEANMIARLCILCAALTALSGCVLTPRIELSESLYFDSPMPSQAPVSYGDVMCSA